MQQFLILLALTLILPQANASGVFKCVNADGVVTFSYTPCAEVAAPKAHKAGPSIEEVLEELDVIDARIATINREFRDLRLEHEASLRATSDADKQAQLRRDYQQMTQDMLRQLSHLKSERGSLVESSVNSSHASNDS